MQNKGSNISERNKDDGRLNSEHFLSAFHHFIFSFQHCQIYFTKSQSHLFLLSIQEPRSKIYGANIAPVKEGLVFFEPFAI